MYVLGAVLFKRAMFSQHLHIHINVYVYIHL